MTQFLNFLLDNYNGLKISLSSFVLGVFPSAVDLDKAARTMEAAQHDEILFWFQLAALSTTVLVGMLTAITWFKKNLFGNENSRHGNNTDRTSGNTL